MSNRTVAGCLATTLLALMSASFATSQQTNSGGAQAPAAAQHSSASAVNDPTYVIGAEDVLRIDVWKEPEMSGNVPVRPDGKISLSLIGDVPAAGLTPMELTKQLTTLLKKYIEDPRVTVTVSAVNSRRVYILGQVTRPGAFPLLPEMTVLQALSTAGGLTPYAAANKIYVLRTENGTQVKLSFEYKNVLKGRKQEQNILLKPGDTIVVP